MCKEDGIVDGKTVWNKAIQNFSWQESPGGKGGQCVRLEPSVPLQACNETGLPFFTLEHTWNFIFYNLHLMDNEFLLFVLRMERIATVRRMILRLSTSTIYPSWFELPRTQNSHMFAAYDYHASV